MQIVLIGNRVVAHGNDCFLCMGGTVICEETGKKYSNATVAEVEAVPADIDTVGYEYRAGVFVPCAPYGVGAGELMVACEECGTPKRSTVTADADGGLNIPGFLKGAKIVAEIAQQCGLEAAATLDSVLASIGNIAISATNTAEERAIVECGSYVGTGQTGANSPNSLNFSFPPKAVLIVGDNDWTSYFAILLFVSSSYVRAGGKSAFAQMYTKIDGNTVYWYSTGNAASQMNSSGTTHYYVALG